MFCYKIFVMYDMLARARTPLTIVRKC